MALIKCKMCGGDLEIAEGTTVAECEYCGSKQTVPSADNEKKLTLFSRANRLRLACEFDKAAGVYENIVAEFPTEAEAYWGLVLCRYGIEYVDDPADGKKVPTCHRSSFDSILEDRDFEQACENADAAARRVYRDEAKEIEEIRKGVLEVSGKEEPYDIFICYKETDENGDRTVDSVLAQDVYDALTDKGYRVFFSRITLEDRLGSEYEPYIFAALNSAKIMLAFGTDYEYYNAVWVKNEWSRYLKLMEKDKSKYLIPCYKGIDAYDMPKEFAKLQAQDMGKVGAIQDLLRGIEKIIPREKPVAAVQEKVVVGGSGNNKIASLLDRGNMALEDGDWAKADSFFEDVLNNDSKNAQAYLGKTLALNKCRTIDAFVRQRKELSKNVRGETLKLEPETKHIDEVVYRSIIPNYIKGDDIRSFYQFVLSYHSDVAERVRQYQSEEKFWAEHKQLSRAEKFAMGSVAENLAREKKALFTVLNDRIEKAKTEEQSAIRALQEKYAEHIKSADAKAEALYKQKLQQRETDYKKYLEIANNSSLSSDLGGAAEFFDQLGDYQDSKKLAEHCRKRIAEEREKQQAEEAKKAKDRAAKKKRITISITTVGFCAIAAFLVVIQVVIPNHKYQNAVSLMNAGQYEDAIAAFEELDGYKDSAVQITECNELINADKYENAVSLKEAGQYEDAIAAFEELDGYKDSADQITECKELINSNKYVEAVSLKEAGQYVAAIAAFEELDGYKDSADQITECKGLRNADKYENAVSLKEAEQYEDAIRAFEELNGYKDCKEQILQCKYNLAVEWKESGDYANAALKFAECVGYSDAKEQSLDLWGEITQCKTVSTGFYSTVALKADGTIWNNGDIISTWTDIVAISVSFIYEVGLKTDGTVVGTGAYGNQCDVSDWTNIAAISAGEKHVVGLKTDGTVVATGSNDYDQCDVSDWTDIVAISAGDEHTVGLKIDGTVVAAGFYDRGQCLVSDWTDIVAISAGGRHTVGLTAYGRVIATGSNEYGQCDVSGWADIAAISAGDKHTVGLKTDGTVVATGSNEYGQCNVSDWTDVVAVSAGGRHTVGLKSDGTLIATGSNSHGQCDVSDLTDIRLP